MRRLALVPILVLVISCATFKHNATPVSTQITSQLENISRIADSAFTDKAKRAEFARVVMLPAIDANRGFTICLLDNKCNQLPIFVAQMAQAILNGISQFAGLLPNSTIKNELINSMNTSLVFINKLYTIVGGK